MDDIVTRLRDPDYAGALQHLRSWDEIDRLFNAAADLIMSLRAEVDRSNEVEETTHGLYKFWNAKAQELAASNDALRSENDRLGKLAKSLSAILDKPDREEAIVDVIADRDSWRNQCELRDDDISRLTKERDEARRALEPFAECVSEWDGEPDSLHVFLEWNDENQPVPSIPVACFRRAAALRQKSDVPTDVNDMPGGERDD